MFTGILSIIGTIAITLVIIGTQKYLSTRKFGQLGAIVPRLMGEGSIQIELKKMRAKDI